MKCLKVRRQDKLEVYGVAAEHLEQCISKGCGQLKINRRNEFSHISLADGTRIDDDDYFQSLDKDTLLVFNLINNSGSAVDMVTQVLNALRMDKDLAKKLIAQAESIDDNLMRSLLLNLAESSGGNIEAETREEDLEWFKGVGKKYRTKSAVMETSAMNRVRSYYYDAKNMLKGSDLTEAQKDRATAILDGWFIKLKEEHMFKHYFSRTNPTKSITFCDMEGWFKCQGAYQAERCRQQHLINPYMSALHRAVFSQWNLDHQIEKARTVLPKVIELIKSDRAHKVNWDYFYRLMFTRQNLKLVHIACHIKQEHTTAKVDMKAAFAKA